MLNGKEKYVAYILIDKTERSMDDILKDIANSRYMTAGNVVAITTVKENSKIDSNIIKKVRKYKMEYKIMCSFYNPMDYHDIYFEKMNDEDKEYSFKVTYNTDESVIDNLKNKGF